MREGTLECMLTRLTGEDNLQRKYYHCKDAGCCKTWPLERPRRKLNHGSEDKNGLRVCNGFFDCELCRNGKLSFLMLTTNEFADAMLTR